MLLVAKQLLIQISVTRASITVRLKSLQSRARVLITYSRNAAPATRLTRRTMLGEIVQSCQTATEIWVRRFFARRGRRRRRGSARAEVDEPRPPRAPLSPTDQFHHKVQRPLRPTDQPFIPTTCQTLSKYNIMNEPEHYIRSRSTSTGKLDAMQHISFQDTYSF